ncbi:MAG: serine hydrolase domain-containing protein [Pseudomonadota bacterium]
MSDFSLVTGILEAAVERGSVPWAALLVTQGGQDLYAHAVGTDLDHVDVLRSATKIATVTALMRLVDRNLISLDDPASRYIPSFAGEKRDISVRHLLSMNSGLPWNCPAFSDEMPLSEAADVIAKQPLSAAPGARFIYGNLGLTVAGRVAEVVSGQTWDQYFKEAVADPLGMKFTYSPLATGRLGGGGRTNLFGYDKLLKMHLAGGVHEGDQFLSASLVESMQQPNGSAFKNPIKETPFFGYGMGWWFDVVDNQGRPLVISDAGTWGAYPWIDRQRRYAAFLFVRSTLAAGSAIVHEVRPVIEKILEDTHRG